MSKVLQVLAGIWVMVVTAQATTITNTFVSGEVPSGWTGAPAPTFGSSGLSDTSFYALGVTFTFSDTSNETYGAPVNWGAINQALQGPGDTTITLTFDNPSTFLSFDINFGIGVTPNGNVEFNGGNSSGSFSTSDPLSSGIAMGTFSSGAKALSPFTTAVISFDSADMYALGNLTYTVPDSPDPPDPPAVPEPGSMILLGGGLVALGVWRPRVGSGVKITRK